MAGPRENAGRYDPDFHFVEMTEIEISTKNEIRIIVDGRCLLNIRMSEGLVISRRNEEVYYNVLPHDAVPESLKNKQALLDREDHRREFDFSRVKVVKKPEYKRRVFFKRFTPAYWRIPNPLMYLKNGRVETGEIQNGTSDQARSDRIARRDRRLAKIIPRTTVTGATGGGSDRGRDEQGAGAEGGRSGNEPIN